MTHPSIIPCQRGFVARRRVDNRVEYMGRDLRWEDSLGAAPECIVTRPFTSARKAWGGLIAWAYQNEQETARRNGSTTAHDLAARIVIISPPNTVPLRFKLDDKEIGENQFMQACQEHGVDVQAVANIVCARPSKTEAIQRLAWKMMKSHVNEGDWSFERTFEVTGIGKPCCDGSGCAACNPDGKMTGVGEWVFPKFDDPHPESAAVSQAHAFIDQTVDAIKAEKSKEELVSLLDLYGF